MVEDSTFLIGICLIPTFIFSFVLLGFDFLSGIITVVTIMMIVVDTAGLSSLWGVHLNAVSLINLVQVSSYKLITSSLISLRLFYFT